MTRGFLPFFALLLLILAFALPAQADRGAIPLGDVDIYGPGQKAIAAWNGETERLILSTDLRASADAKALEILPLPSEPSIEEGSLESFEAAQRIIRAKVPLAKEARAGLEVVFHERIGAHDITVVRASSAEELVGLMAGYAAKEGEAPRVQESAKKLVEDYLARGFAYWVFDLVDLTADERTVQPIAYEFKSSFLYYPMKISATARGWTEILLFLLTAEPVEHIPPKMRALTPPLELSPEELAEIDRKVATLFNGGAWLSAVKYEGDLAGLDFDLEYPRRPCRSIKVSTDKADYELGETVTITVTFTHLLPGCFEAQALHFHQIRLEVFDPGGALIQSWLWETNGDARAAVKWKPSKAGGYVIKASSWWNGEKLEVEDSRAVAVFAPPGLNGAARWFLYGAVTAAASMLAGAGMAYLLLKRGGQKP